ncbi:hypothetical protein ACF0H5_021396 [Mactra antiquata]
MNQEVTETMVETLPPKSSRTIYDYIEYMSKHPEKGDQILVDIEEKLADIGNVGVLIEDANNRQKETILHTAVKCLQFKSDHEMNVVEILLDKFPTLILQHRADTEYAGQTPLHMAVCKGNRRLVEVMLRHISSGQKKYWKKPLLKRLACGSIFDNTAMSGQLPLSIAALTFNKGMFDLLLSEGAKLDGRNSDGDTVCHSLIKYGHINPDKINDVIEMCRHLVEDPSPYDTSNKAVQKRKLRKKIWSMENRKGLNPLQLSVKLGMHAIFMFIVELEAYCSKNSSDGLFDIKIYDVTEIDAISYITDSAQERDKNDNQARNQNNPTQQPTVNSKIMLGDMFRFFFIIGIEIVAFATAMYMVLQGSNESHQSDYENLWRMFFSMFTLMVGLGDMADFYNTRQPFLCMVIFIVFVVMTTLLMINSLIALISRTCTELVENVGNIRASDRHYKLQRLSIVLFLESIFMKSQIEIGGKRTIQPRYQNSCNRRRYVDRYLLEMRLSQNDDEDEGDDTMATGSWGFRTMINAIRHNRRLAKSRPSSAISDRIRNFFKGGSKRSDNQVISDLPDGIQMNGTRQAMSQNGPGILDIYHINRCESCNDTEIIRN